MTFPDIAAKPALNAERRGGFLLPQTREIWLTGHLWNIEYCLLEVQICFLKNIKFKRTRKRGRYRGPGTNYCQHIP